MGERQTGHHLCMVMAFLAVLAVPVADEGQILVGHGSTVLEDVPLLWIRRAIDHLHIVYSHTCPGGQIISGMDALASFPPYGDQYAWSDDGSAGLDIDVGGIPCDVSDLGQGDFLDESGVSRWASCTRNYLNAPENEHINVVMWAWCSVNGHDAQRYVDTMESLIFEYPDVQFVFMTGRAQGQGEDLSPGSVHFNNQLIRQHCEENGRVLYDFADIEAYDPDGTYFWDLGLWNNLDYDGGNWAQQWIVANPGTVLAQLTNGEGVPDFDGCLDCANSDFPEEAKLNCVLKARAAWWMFAAISGWYQGELPPPRRPSGRVAP